MQFYSVFDSKPALIQTYCVCDNCIDLWRLMQCLLHKLQAAMHLMCDLCSLTVIQSVFLHPVSSLLYFLNIAAENEMIGLVLKGEQFLCKHYILPPPVWPAAVRGVPPRVPTTSPPAAAMPPTLPLLPLPPHHPGPPAPSPPPSPPTSTRILSNMSRVGLQSTQRSRYVPPSFHWNLPF